MMEAHDLWQLNDSGQFGWLGCPWDGSVLVECQVCTAVAVIIEIGFQDTPPTSLIEYDHMIQTLSSN
jgi:hypothetical protein